MTDQDQIDVSVPEFLRRLDAGWDALQTFIASLTPDQLTGPADAVGWTVKSHLIHITAWEDGMNAALAHQSRRERMGVPLELWDTDDYDAENEVIQERHRGESLDTVLAELNRVHSEFHARIAALTDTDLMRPSREFASDSTSDSPIIWSLVGNSFGHYEEHLPWMQAIVGDE
jgi:hypothetical protein